MLNFIPCLLLSAAALLPQTDIFDQFDTNSDGRIEPSEMPRGIGPVRRVLQQRDMNGDGIVTRDEFLGRSQPTREPAPGPDPEQNQPRRRSIFDVLDRDGDGVVTREEVPAELQDRVGAIFEATGKQALTRSDFLPPKRVTFFSFLDTDKNGRVTQAEITAAARDPEARHLDGLRTKPLFDALIATGAESFDEKQLNAVLLPLVRQQTVEQGFADAFKHLDVNNDGRVSLEEAPPAFREALRRMLARGDLPLEHELTFEEFERLARAAQKAAAAATSTADTRSAPPAPRVPAAFQLLDADRSGTLTPDELTDVISRLARLDIDRNGSLSVNEFVGTFKPSQPTAQQPAAQQPAEPVAEPSRLVQQENFVDAFFGQFDKDKNGKLTLAEVPASVARRFDSMDYDQDGAVSRSEMLEAMLTQGKKQ